MIHSAIYLNKASINDDNVKPYVPTRMLIADEVSMGGKDIPQQVNRNLNILKETTSVVRQARNGNIPVLWGGDMGQLPPPCKGGKMFYMTNTPEWDNFI